jgi:hypothetical protein
MERAERDAHLGIQPVAVALLTLGNGGRIEIAPVLSNPIEQGLMQIPIQEIVELRIWRHWPDGHGDVAITRRWRHQPRLGR